MTKSHYDIFYCLFLQAKFGNKLFIIKPYIFNKFPEITCGFTTKIGLERKEPYFFNISFAVGDDEKIVEENRSALFSSMKLDGFRIHFQKQTHSDIVRIVNSDSVPEESDAMICSESKNALVIISADCTSIFIFDSVNKIIAAVHSGWRGTQKRILEKTLNFLFDKFNSSSKDLFVYMGPSISQANYQIGDEVAELFESKYLLKIENKFYLDVSFVNYDMLMDYGVPKNQIQKSTICTYEMNELFHSYRRDGEKSGRSLGVIALK